MFFKCFRFKFIASSAILAMSAMAQTDIVLTGKVLDGNNNPVPFVEVESPNYGLKDTTGSDGTWSLSKTGVVGVNKIISSSTQTHLFTSGLLEFNLKAPQYVQVEFVSLNGQNTTVVGGFPISNL